MNKVEGQQTIHVFTPGFLPLKEAAIWAGISTKTLKRWVEKGLPQYQGCSRGKILIKPSDIENFLCRKEAIPQNLNKMVDDAFRELQSNQS